MRKSILLLTIIYSTFLSSQNDFAAYTHKQDSLYQLNTGKPYPAFTAVSLEGKRMTEKELTGKVTIINFWFQYCEPCVAEFDAMNDLYRKFKDNPAFRFISFTSDSADSARLTVVKYKLSFPVFPVSEKECFRLNMNQGFPTTIIIDKAGRMALLKSGGYTESDKVVKDIAVYEQKINDLLEMQ
jgi:peroxiredoxin